MFNPHLCGSFNYEGENFSFTIIFNPRYLICKVVHSLLEKIVIIFFSENIHLFIRQYQCQHSRVSSEFTNSCALYPEPGLPSNDLNTYIGIRSSIKSSSLSGSSFLQGFFDWGQFSLSDMAY